MQLTFYACEYSFFKLPYLETPRCSLCTSCELKMATYLAKVLGKLQKLKSHSAGFGPNPALWNLTELLWAYWKYFFSRMLQFISLPLKIKFIRDTNAQLIQNSITSYHKNQERTRTRKQERKKGKINHMTERKRRQNLVAAFFCKGEWITETAPQWTSENNFLKKSSKYWL